MQNTTDLVAVDCPTPAKGMYHVYILLCSNSSLYTGHTSNVQNRLTYHHKGKASLHTKISKPRKLVYYEGPLTKKKAIQREKQIKGWSRVKKVVLIKGDLIALKFLSRAR